VSTLPIAITRSLPSDRTRDLTIFAGLVLWLVYTRVFFVLQALHLTMPPCPFYFMTGHPCPFCGGTRSFAFMWQGDIANSVRLYPLGPALFAGTFAGAGALAAGLVTGRTWTPRLTRLQWTLLGIAAAGLITFSWALKVFVLGN
jgi:hypothetical protein